MIDRTLRNRINFIGRVLIVAVFIGAIDNAHADESELAIPPGSNVKVELTQKVTAPVNGEFVRANFRTTGSIETPEGKSLPFVVDSIVAEAQGDETSSRAIFRVKEIVIKGFENPFTVEGYILGDDGNPGIPGSLIDVLPRFMNGPPLKVLTDRELSELVKAGKIKPRFKSPSNSSLVPATVIREGRSGLAAFTRAVIVKTR